MRRLLSVTLAITLIGGWLIPSSAEAGPFARLIWRLRGSPTTRTAVVENDGYRRYSYEPGMEETFVPYTAPRTGVKPTWMLPKSDPGRYDAR